MKKCRRCNEEKLKSEFHKYSASPDGLNYMCKSCFIIYRNSPEERKQRGTSSKYTLGTKEYDRDCYLRSVYKITLFEYNALLKEQNYSCAICGITQDKLLQNLCVDHDHLTQNVRGLLCPECNQGIGKLKDNINILQNAIIYLNKSI